MFVLKRGSFSLACSQFTESVTSSPHMLISSFTLFVFLWSVIPGRRVGFADLCGGFFCPVGLHRARKVSVLSLRVRFCLTDFDSHSRVWEKRFRVRITSVWEEGKGDCLCSLGLCFVGEPLVTEAQLWRPLAFLAPSLTVKMSQKSGQ